MAFTAQMGSVHRAEFIVQCAVCSVQCVVCIAAFQMLINRSGLAGAVLQKSS